jgi:hypothetical protein
MEKELRKADLGRYTNADHIEFHETSYAIFDRYGTAIKAPELLAAYQAKVMQEDQIYKWLRRSEFTKKKAETDQERDRILSGILGILHSFEKHFDPSLRDNAEHVLNLIDNYRRLSHTDYDAETASIDSILERLNSSDYIIAVQNLNLMSWLTELARLNTLFKSYAADTEQEQIRKPDVSPKVARHETDEALRNITRHVDSMIILGLLDDIIYEPLVREYNVHVDHYNTLVHEHYGRLHVKTDLSNGEVAPIKMQQYTSEPIYVIPSVTVRKTEKDGTLTIIKLRFSQDFTVEYANNTAPGTATLTINGAGQYVGKIVTTFNIIAPL